MTVNVLIVEDQKTAAKAHADYVGRIDGFRLVGVAHSGIKALSLLMGEPRTARKSLHVDLVLLDMNLPDMAGLELCRTLRMRGVTVDVIAVTAARELEMVQGAVSAGILQYLIKPFTFATFRAKLVGYQEYRTKLGNRQITQVELDRAFAALRVTGDASMPKGLAEPTLTAIVDELRSRGVMSAGEAGGVLGVSRVTARRYLEALTKEGRVDRVPRYGSTGRPEVEYRWIGDR
ncbi:response regulator [Saxibacter everestensis]|uniref:Transcriptional regulatory protein n=1 Tax=Saxibacter everestensis TaxID=2909229 RepID=A0ABY8QSG1_9MICO|nr:response regulator [Brevibacteriaceae bacterium ZFBP1038]